MSNNTENELLNVNTECKEKDCNYLIPSLQDVAVTKCKKCDKLVIYSDKYFKTLNSNTAIANTSI